MPIGYVGVVVSYYGRIGRDVSGDAFRHGERVAEGERGVLGAAARAGQVPVQHLRRQHRSWCRRPTSSCTGSPARREAHRYDESLRSIDLVTQDAYEPMLPLSVVVHIDYQKAPSVIQRFGDVKKLITQTLDPMLQRLLPRHRPQEDDAGAAAGARRDPGGGPRASCGSKFREFDIECVDVLIGKPDTAEAGGKIETLLEQLRLRQLSIEQIETYERQRAAAEKLRTLNEAQAQAAVQTELTNAEVQVQIAESQGEADLARARKQAEQAVVGAEADLARARRQAEQTVVTAEAEVEEAGAGRPRRRPAGRCRSACPRRRCCCARSAAFGDPRLYALSVVGGATGPQHAAAGAGASLHGWCER